MKSKKISSFGPSLCSKRSKCLILIKIPLKLHLILSRKSTAFQRQYLYHRFLFAKLKARSRDRSEENIDGQVCRCQVALLIYKLPMLNEPSTVLHSGNCIHLEVGIYERMENFYVFCWCRNNQCQFKNYEPPPTNMVGNFHDKILSIQNAKSSGNKLAPPSGSPAIESAPHWTTHASGWYLSITAKSVLEIKEEHEVKKKSTALEIAFKKFLLTCKNIWWTIRHEYVADRESWHSSPFRCLGRNRSHRHCPDKIPNGIDEMTL